MGRSVTLLLVLVSRLALAQGVVAEDAPLRMYQPPAPELVGFPNWVLTPDGKERLDATLSRQFSELVQLRTENSELKIALVTWEAKPALTWRGAALIFAGGVVVGGVTAACIVAATR